MNKKVVEMEVKGDKEGFGSLRVRVRESNGVPQGANRDEDGGT